MPKYVYKCKHCDGIFEIVHGMMEEQDNCELCDSTESPIRIPQIPHIKTFGTTSPQKLPVGSVVKEMIQENEKVLKEQKKEARSWEWEKDV